MSPLDFSVEELDQLLDLAVDIENHPEKYAHACDGKKLAESRRILILHLTDVMNSRQKFATQKRDVIVNWGRLPLLAKAGKVRITVNSPLDGYKLYAVDTAGERLFELPIGRTNSQSILNLSVHNKKGTTLAYELVKE